MTGDRFVSQGWYRRKFRREMIAAFSKEYGSPYREPLSRFPWDPRAVSDPGMVADEFPDLLQVRRQ